MKTVENETEVIAKFSKIATLARYAGWDQNVGSAYSEIARVIMDLEFWKSLARAEKWGEWSVKYEDIQHDFVLKYYMPDDEKTPVYHCSVCNLRKQGEELSYDTMGFNQFEPVNEKGKDAICKHHKGFKKDSWQDHMFMFLNFYVNEGNFNKAVEWLTTQVTLNG